MHKRIGFCCQWFHHDQTLKKKQLEEIQRPFNTKATTVRWLNEHKPEAEERLWDLMQHNIASVHELVKYVATLPDELKMVRISSPVLPVATEAWQQRQLWRCKTHLWQGHECGKVTHVSLRVATKTFEKNVFTLFFSGWQRESPHSPHIAPAR